VLGFSLPGPCSCPLAARAPSRNSFLPPAVLHGVSPCTARTPGSSGLLRCISLSWKTRTVCLVRCGRQPKSVLRTIEGTIWVAAEGTVDAVWYLSVQERARVVAYGSGPCECARALCHLFNLNYCTTLGTPSRLGRTCSRSELRVTFRLQVATLAVRVLHMTLPAT
jgi:hypothetical protein